MKPGIEEVMQKLTGKVPSVNSLEEFSALVEKFVGIEYPGMREQDRKEIAAEITDLGPIQKYVSDPAVEDIMVNALDSVFVADAHRGMVRTSASFASYEELELLMRKLLLFSGKDELSKMSDLNVPGQGRANIVFSPFGPVITIRRFNQVPPSMIDLVEWGMMDFGVAAELWLYAEGLGVKPANMLIVGSPSSGKTTLLNSLFSFFQEDHRVVVIEDTLELNTRMRENCPRLVTDGLKLVDLVKNSLRMRPDRLIIGEVRGEEARDMMTAMNIGKICMGTLHAGSARDAVTRLERDPMNVPTSMITLVDVIVTTGRFMSGGKNFRRITGISEVCGIEGDKILLSDRYEFDFKERRLFEKSPSVTYRDRLAYAAGISPKELMLELEMRELVLRKLSKKGVRSIEELALISKKYRTDPEGMLKKLGVDI
jgi:flagellar protein FlaI